MIPFAPFEPDRTRYALDASTSILNAIPVKDGWGPLPDLVPLSQALPSASAGAWSVRRMDGTYRTFAATATRIYELNGTDYSWNDVSGPSAPYACPVGDKWSATKFGQLLIVCNLGGPIQYIDIDVGTAFADLPGSPPVARYLATVGEYLALGYISGHPNRFMLSGIGDAGFWTLGQRGCDLQDFADGEEIMNIQGGERGAIVSHRTAFTEVALTSGGDYSFTTRVINPSRGVIAPLSVVPIGPGIFCYLAQDGFFMNVEGTPIGAERVDLWFQGLADSGYIKEVRGFPDPFRKIAWWQFQDPAGDKYLLGYHWQLDRWCIGDNNVSEMCVIATPGMTWDGIDALYPDWDSADVPWESSLLSGGSMSFAAFREIPVGAVVSRGDFTTGVHRNGANAFTLTRASDGTYFGSDGLLKTAGPNVLRLTHDPTTGKALGCLAEAQATNLYLRSEDFAAGSWQSGGSSTFVGGKLIETATFNTHLIQQTPMMTAGQTYSHTVVAAPAERTKIYLRDTTGSDIFVGHFDLATGSVIATIGAGAIARIKPVGNGDYECSLTFTATATGTNAVRIGLSDGTISGYMGDGTSGAYLRRAQFETGAYPTSYIPTTTAAVTRTADALTFKSIDTNDWVLTFDDGSTQSFSGVTGDLVVDPSTLNRSIIKSYTATKTGGSNGHELGFFTGTPRAARLTTADVELNPGARSFLQQARVYTDCQDFTLRAITSDKHGGARAVGMPVTPYGQTGLCHFRSSALLHAFRMDIPQGADWNHVMGVEAVARREGQR